MAPGIGQLVSLWNSSPACLLVGGKPGMASPVVPQGYKLCEVPLSPVNGAMHEDLLKGSSPGGGRYAGLALPNA